MNRDLIDLQRGSKATCVIVQTNEYKSLPSSVAINASVSDKFLLSGKPPFAEKLESLKSKTLCYLIIKGIDEVAIEEQERFVGLVKDREMNGYILPNNCIIVLTVKDKTTLKKISNEIYHFAVVAF